MKLFKLTAYIIGILSSVGFTNTFATSSNISKERKSNSKAENMHTIVQAKLRKDAVDFTRKAVREAFELGFEDLKTTLESLRPGEAKVSEEFLIYIVKRPNDRGNQKDLYIKFTKTDSMGWSLISFHKQDDEDHKLEARRKQAVQQMLTTPHQGPVDNRPATILKPRSLLYKQQKIKDPSRNN